MNTAILNIKIDPQAKKRPKSFIAELDVELEPTPYLVKIMNEVKKDVRARHAAVKTNTPDELLAHLG